MQTVEFQRLAESAAQIQQNFERHFDDSRAKTYLLTYPYYVCYLDQDRRLTKKDLLIAAALVYSWMPRVLILDRQYLDQAVDCLNHVKKIIPPPDVSQPDLEPLAKALNGSIIGMSKLLHFLNPGVFPIYDTKVYRYINQKKSAVYQTVNSMESYLAYTQNVHQLIGHERFEQDVFTPLKDSVLRLAGYGIGRVRAVELVMFLDANKRDLSQHPRH